MESKSEVYVSVYICLSACVHVCVCARVYEFVSVSVCDSDVWYVVVDVPHVVLAGQGAFSKSQRALSCCRCVLPET